METDCTFGSVWTMETQWLCKTETSCNSFVCSPKILSHPWPVIQWSQYKAESVWPIELSSITLGEDNSMIEVNSRPNADRMNQYQCTHNTDRWAEHCIIYRWCWYPSEPVELDWIWLEEAICLLWIFTGMSHIHTSIISLKPVTSLYILFCVFRCRI